MESSIYYGERVQSRLAGQLDADGKVWRGKRWDSDLVGEVDADGKVWRGKRLDSDLVGEVDADGKVWRGKKWDSDLVGEVDADGKVWRGKRWDSDLVGDTEPPSSQGGAALLLLLDEEANSGGLLSGIGEAVAAAAVTEGIRWWKRSRQREAPGDQVAKPSVEEEDPDSLEALERHRAMWGSPKEAGFANTSGDVVAEAAVSAGMTVWEYLDEEPNPPSPVELEKLMRRHWDISHVSCLVLGGSKEKLERYVGQMYRPQVILYSADTETISALGLQVIDAPQEVTPALVGYPHIDQASVVADAIRSSGCGVMSLTHSEKWDQTPTPQVANAMLRISSWSARGRPVVAVVVGPTDFITFYAPHLEAPSVVCLSGEPDLEQAGVPVVASIEAMQTVIEDKVGSEGRERNQALKAFQLPIPPSLSGSFKVVLKDKGPTASMVALALKEYVGGDTFKAYKLTQEAPGDVVIAINVVLAEAIADKLRAAGAEVEVVGPNGSP